MNFLKGMPGLTISTRAWVILRKTVQYLALALFILLFIKAQPGGWPPAFANAALRVDPLVMLAHLLSEKTFLIASSLALVTILLTVVFGRAWCGWLCPLGTILDLFPIQKGRKAQSAPPESLRKVKYALLLVILIAALFGNLTLLILDPLTILYRTLTTSIWPALDRLLLSAEKALYPIPPLSAPVSTFDQWIRPALFPVEPLYYHHAALYALVFLAILLSSIFAPRFWCRYLCPLGALLGVVSKFSLFRRAVAPGCKDCGICAKSCPTGTIDPRNDYASDPGECTLCLDCLDSCPRSAIEFKPQQGLAAWKEYDPRRRDVITALGASMVGLALFQSDILAKRAPSHLLRPPGTSEESLLARCIRCGLCLRACPTAALQPALTEAGLEGLWTPILIARAGFCDYSCNACGQVCPVQAIPPLALDEKRQAVIGKAYIDQNRCIAWSDHTDCIVCEEMCPVANKAIQFELLEFLDPDGAAASVKVPHVLRDRCIGCGICEYKCPVNGDSAIRVYVPNPETGYF